MHQQRIMANFDRKLLTSFEIKQRAEITQNLVANFNPFGILIEKEGISLPDVFTPDSYHLFLKTVELKSTFVNFNIFRSV